MTGDLEILGTRPRGRPTLYNSAYCDRVLELAAQGWSKAEIAADLGVAAQDARRLGRGAPRVPRGFARAKDLEYAWWLKAGREGHSRKNWNLASWEAADAQPLRQSVSPGRAPTRSASREPKDSTNAERIREEIERKLSRIADAGAAEGVSREPDAEGGGEPGSMIGGSGRGPNSARQ